MSCCRNHFLFSQEGVLGCSLRQYNSDFICSITGGELRRGEPWCYRAVIMPHFTDETSLHLSPSRTFHISFLAHLRDLFWRAAVLLMTLPCTPSCWIGFLFLHLRPENFSKDLTFKLILEVLICLPLYRFSLLNLNRGVIFCHRGFSLSTLRTCMMMF